MRKTLKLFSELTINALFRFLDKPGRILIKSDSTHYIAPEGRRVIHPHVLVEEAHIKTIPGGRTIYDKFMVEQGDHDD